MKRLWHATILIFGGILAACAFAAPSMALGPSWGPLGTQHLLTSTNFGLEVHIPGGGVAGVACGHTQMPTDVWQLTRLTVTDATFANCQGTGIVANCTATLRASGLPWTVTGAFWMNVVLDGVRLGVQFENRPGAGTCGLLPGTATATVTGSVGGGDWALTQHQIHYSADTGLTAHAPGLFAGPAVTTTTGTLRDATQTLTA